mmetsp:Transcript_20011/g.47685  ORF Transcript_20011/g.47685 Transcript_20011/m.47685 type:complete len:209 (+) Transcript_20011:71-697(+)
MMFVIQSQRLEWSQFLSVFAFPSAITACARSATGERAISAWWSVIAFATFSSSGIPAIFCFVDSSSSSTALRATGWLVASCRGATRLLLPSPSESDANLSDPATRCSSLSAGFSRNRCDCFTPLARCSRYWRPRCPRSALRARTWRARAASCWEMASKNLSTRCLSRQSDTSAAFSTADVGSTSAPFPRRSRWLARACWVLSASLSPS